jgi:hypothetical protein
MALDDHHVSDDLHQWIEDKRRAAGQVIDALYLALEGHRFGAVMAHLMVDQDRVHDRIVRVPPSVRLTSAVAPAAGSAGRRVVAPAVASAAAGRASPPVTPGAAGPRIRTLTAEMFQAETAVEVWIEGLTRFQEDIPRLSRFGFTPATANALAGELVHGLRRTGVIDRTTELLRAISFGHTVDKQALPASIVCADAINGFVATLGYDRVPVPDRPVVTLPEGGTRPVFTAHVPSDTAADLPADPRGIAESHWTDWVHALLALFEANAQDGAAGRIDIAQNARLGQILAGLRGMGTGAA